MPPIITLTTDFGMRDPYVAQMKGAILSRCPEARIVDLTHEIAPQDIMEGALFLQTALPAFPPETIHIAVVDPRVGSSRRALIMRVRDQYLLAPDNGLVTLLAEEKTPFPIVEIAHSRFVAESISPTFHGRDVFAPAAAELACGMSMAMAGPGASEIEMLHIHEPEMEGRLLSGEIIHVDRFGNLITNVRVSHFRHRRPVVAIVGNGGPVPVRTIYADVEPGMPVCLVGSSGRYEFAVRDGSAAGVLGCKRGVAVQFVLEE
jgi:S-adenosylmethionine hydrolase